MALFEQEQQQTQYSKLGYMTDLQFHEYKLAIETYENFYGDRNINYEIKKKKKKKEKKLGCEFIRIDPDKEDFEVHKKPSVK